MIDNLKYLNGGNHTFVKEEEIIADKRLAVEISIKRRELILMSK